MKSIPFSFYDFFGYLAPGFLTLAVIDLVFLDKYLYKQDKSIVAFWVLLVGGAYLVGHVLALFCNSVYERLIVSKWLKKPATNLFLDREIGLEGKLFKNYFESLPEQIRKKILEKATREHLEIPKLIEAALPNKKITNKDLTDDLKNDIRALYLHAHSRVKLNEVAMAQQDTFLKLYGFARNISFSSLVATFLIIYHCIAHCLSQNWHWLVVFFVSFIAMFYVYLKFYRWHTRELFLAYSELPPQDPIDNKHKSKKSNEYVISFDLGIRRKK